MRILWTNADFVNLLRDSSLHRLFACRLRLPQLRRSGNSQKYFCLLLCIVWQIWQNSHSTFRILSRRPRLSLNFPQDKERCNFQISNLKKSGWNFTFSQFSLIPNKAGIFGEYLSFESCRAVFSGRNNTQDVVMQYPLWMLVISWESDGNVKFTCPIIIHLF